MHPVLNIFVSLFTAYITVLVIVGILTMWGFSRQDFTQWLIIGLLWLAGVSAFLITFITNLV